MPNLTQIKERLEKLPEFHKEKGLKDNFSDYGTKVSESLKELEKAYKNLKSLDTLEANVTSRKNVLTEIKDAIRDAKKIKEDITSDAQNILKTATSNAVIRITEAHKNANRICLERWNSFIENRKRKWSNLVNVVNKLPNTGGTEFKNAFDNLTNHVNIPQTKAEIQKIQDFREELNSGVAKLGLEGEPGKFLEAAAKGDATISELDKSEVREFLDQYDLWNSFKIKLD